MDDITTTESLPNAIREQAEGLLAMRQAQDADFQAIKSAEKPEDKSRLKEALNTRRQQLDEAGDAYETAIKSWKEEQDNKAGIKGVQDILSRSNMAASTRPHNFGGAGVQEQNADVRSLGERILTSKEFQAGFPGVKSMGFNVVIDGWTPDDEMRRAAIKTNMTIGSSWAPYGPRIPEIVPIALRMPVFADMIPQETMDSPLFYYMEETTHTNNADYVAEAGSKPENAYALTSRTVQPAKIATTLPVTEELMEDVPQAQSFINQRLAFDITYKEEDALLNFTNGSNVWDGFLQKSGVQSQAKGTDPTPTAVLKAITKVMYSPGFAGMPTGLAMNPTDWQNVLTLQETTGAYIWSMPSAPTTMPDMRMWGMMVRATPALTAGTALLGNFLVFSKIWRRTGLTIRVGYANDDVIKNLIRLIAEERLALTITRAAAFCKVTGL